MREISARKAAGSMVELCAYVAESGQPIKILGSQKRACLLVSAEAYKIREEKLEKLIAQYESNLAMLSGEPVELRAIGVTCTESKKI